MLDSQEFKAVSAILAHPKNQEELQAARAKFYHLVKPLCLATIRTQYKHNPRILGESEDLVDEVIVRMFRSIERHIARPETFDRPAAYVINACKHHCVNWSTHDMKTKHFSNNPIMAENLIAPKKRYQAFLDEYGLKEEDIEKLTQGASFFSAKDRERVEAAIGTLSETYRECLRKYYFGDLDAPLKEYGLLRVGKNGGKEEVPVMAIKRRISEGKGKLYQALEAQGDAGSAIHAMGIVDTIHDTKKIWGDDLHAAAYR